MIMVGILLRLLISSILLINYTTCIKRKERDIYYFCQILFCNILIIREDVIAQLRDVHMYLGVPYALPPTGPLRFKDPVACPLWDGEKMAGEYGGYLQIKAFVDF